MAKKLPKKIYVRWQESDREPFLDASIKKDELAERGKTIHVGVYELRQEGHLVTKIHFE